MDSPISTSPRPPKNKASSPLRLQIDRRAIPGVREIIVVASGKGGVGKSTVSCNLAIALAMSGKRVGILDADIYGPSAPLMFGLKPPLAVNDDAQLIPKTGHGGVKVVSFGFLSNPETPIVWRGPLISKALEQLFFEVAWGELDYLVVDLPPGTGDVQLTLIEKVPIHHAIVVTTPQDVALIDARKALAMFQKLEVPVLGFVENMAVHVCSSCGHQEAIFGSHGVDALADANNLQVLARIPLQAAIRYACDNGRPSACEGAEGIGSPYFQLAEKVIAEPFRI